MTPKRSLLLLLSLLAAFIIGASLWSSLKEPQFQNRLELYQTDLILQASELRLADPNVASARRTLLGEQPLRPAAAAYTKFLRSVGQECDRLKTMLAEAEAKLAPAETIDSLEKELHQRQQLLAELHLRLGVLQAQQGEVAAAQTTWEKVAAMNQGNLQPLGQTAIALAGLWREPPEIVNDADALFKKNLDGWFRYQALSRLYDLQQRQADQVALQRQQQALAEKAFSGLAIATTLPAIGGVIGTGLLLFLLGQWVLKRKQSLLSFEAKAEGAIAPPPWDWETILQVLLGFLLLGQAVVPLGLRALLQAVGSNIPTMNPKGMAFFYLANYVLVAAASLAVLYFSVKPFLPVENSPWLRVKWGGKWLLWGIGGYLVAIPLVTLVTLVNQSIWQGQGGSNPLLPIALQSKDGVALAIFFGMAAIAAPIFEEILFRGFLLPSLTRYLPVSGAIVVSAIAFAVAHLSLSEVLPLTVLGMILGIVYLRSQNLLASMLLHSLWNAGTLVSLFILGSAGG